MDELDDPVRHDSEHRSKEWWRHYTWLRLWMEAIADDGPQVNRALRKLMKRTK